VGAKTRLETIIHLIVEESISLVLRLLVKIEAKIRIKASIPRILIRNSETKRIIR